MEVIDVNIKPIYTQVTGIIVWLNLYGLSAWIVVKLDIYFRWEIYIYIYIYITFGDQLATLIPGVEANRPSGPR